MMYEYWLAKLWQLSAEKRRKLREMKSDAKTVYEMDKKEMEEITFLTEKDVKVLQSSKNIDTWKKEYEDILKKDIYFIPYYFDDYPKRLRNISDSPYALYCKGKLPNEMKTSVAIVGARRCTAYGENLALMYGQALAEAGVQVISGMAAGIDGAGQRGALNGNGSTYGVLGCGVDICYPRHHIGLYQDILREGGLISELPPGTPPLARHFPARNRIISGLSDAVLIMEAKEKSGSLITADMALEQGKEVYALPGPVTSPLSQGCHHLINQGAGILLGPEELLKELNIQTEIRLSRESEKKKELESSKNIVYSCLDFFPKGIHTLVEMTKMPPEDVLGELVSLQLEGLIREISKNYYVRIR